MFKVLDGMYIPIEWMAEFGLWYMAFRKTWSVVWEETWSSKKEGREE